MDENTQKGKNKHPAPFSLRLTWEEREELDRLADGQPWSRYIKAVIFILKRKPPRNMVAPIEDKKLFAKLLAMLGQSRIASNINQLAKAVNSGSLPVNAEVEAAILEACKAILWMRDTLIKAIGLKPQSHDPAENPNDPQG